MQNAAQEGKRRLFSGPEDAATETADTNPESENPSETVVTVATVAAAGRGAAAFAAPRLAWF